MRNHISEHIEQYILEGCTHKNKRRIGVEVETIIYNKNHERIPVNRGSDFSSADFIREIETANSNSKNFFNFSIEPGGQLEWASKPYDHIHAVDEEFSAFQKLFDQICREHQLYSIGYATEPMYKPQDITLIHLKKYQLMHDLFQKTGEKGPWMMRNTASVQINIDLIDELDAQEAAFIADCLNPFSAILFSNSPFINRKPVGNKNVRYKIWFDTDPDRCGHLLDHHIAENTGLIANFCQYVSSVPVIFTTPDEKGDYGSFQGTVGDWLKTKIVDSKIAREHLKTALHQIFTHVRFKTVLEIRSADKPPKGFELAPVAFWTALMERGQVRQQLLEEISSWSIEERTRLNQSANNVDLHQIGPKGKTITFWMEWLAELIFSSLDRRAEDGNFPTERKFFEPFINYVLSRGVFTMQTQESFLKSGLMLPDFIYRENANV